MVVISTILGYKLPGFGIVEVVVNIDERRRFSVEDGGVLSGERDDADANNWNDKTRRHTVYPVSD